MNKKTDEKSNDTFELNSQSKQLSLARATATSTRPTTTTATNNMH